MTQKRGAIKYKDQFTRARTGNLESMICVRMDRHKPGYAVYVLHSCETDGFWYTKGISVGGGVTLRGSELLCIEMH